MELAIDIRPPIPPALPPLNLDWTMSFMMVIPALFTASCLFPLEGPPDESNSLDASAIARETKSDLELGLLPPPSPPPVNFFKTYKGDYFVRLRCERLRGGIAVSWTEPARRRRYPWNWRSILWQTPRCRSSCGLPSLLPRRSVPGAIKPPHDLVS